MIEEITDGDGCIVGSLDANDEIRLGRVAMTIIEGIGEGLEVGLSARELLIRPGGSAKSIGSI